MPLYDYYCEACGHWQKDQFTHLAREAPASLVCPICEGLAQKMPGIPVMMSAWHERAPIDGAHNIFAGTKLEDSDGKNRVWFKSKKAQVDLGT